MKKIFLFATALILIWVSYLIANYIELYSYIYIFIMWAVACLGVFFVTKNQTTKLRLTALYLGSIFIAFGLAEAYYIGFFSKKVMFQSVNTQEIIYGESFYFHPLLGYKPSPNSSYRESRYIDNELVSSYNHTTDEFGWRSIPKVDSSESKEAILFLGGSYTYGLGVKDEETSSYRLQENLDSEQNVFNFSVSGYGPHQILAILQNSLEVEVVGNHQSKWGVFQAIQDHIYRVKGEAWWDYFGPKYELSENDEVIYKGAFNNYYIARFKSLLAKSLLVRNTILKRSKVTDRDIELMARIIKKSATIFEERYEGEFYVLMWEEKINERLLYDKIYKKLVELNLTVIEIADILPNYYPSSPDYYIKGDNHPNPHSHSLISRYIEANIIRKVTE